MFDRAFGIDGVKWPNVFDPPRQHEVGNFARSYEISSRIFSTHRKRHAIAIDVHHAPIWGTPTDSFIARVRPYVPSFSKGVLSAVGTHARQYVKCNALSKQLAQ